MRILIIGGVAAGTSVAAKARRNDETCEICVYEKGKYISYSTCGMPYLIGRKDIDADDLTPRDPEWFRKRFRIDIQTGKEVLSIDRESRQVQVKDLVSGTVFSDRYDELVLATGCRASLPPIPGIDKPHVFTLKTMEDTLDIASYLNRNPVQNAVVVGGGFIGLEIYENLTERGILTTLIEGENRFLPFLDRDMGIRIQEYMDGRKLPYLLEERVSRIEDSRIITEGGKTLPADLVLVSVGVRPDTALAEAVGLELGETGGIRVDQFLSSSDPHIKAVGDCAEVWSVADQRPMFRPMGSTANKMGRIAGDRLTGGALAFRGVLGTGIVKFFDLHIGLSGITEREARTRGLDIEIIHNIKENQSRYLPESREMVIKALADRGSGKLLGVQIIGERGVDKRLDVFATAMTFGATAEDLFHLDLSYAPPFSTTKDPVMYTGMILHNALTRNRRIITPAELSGREKDFLILDVRSAEDYQKGHIKGARNIPLANLREQQASLARSKPIIVHCNKGVTGNAAQNLLIDMGFDEVYNLSGGYKNYYLYTKYI